MSVPLLYLEGLMQRALLGDAALNAYKLGIIEAVLKEALAGDPVDAGALRDSARTALDVARWDMPRTRSPRSR
ncbi:MAG: hypothetical protein M3179_13275 [Actinomycetota bacterium]|nr:hypothetical protein [Actinomycetota bacterium]